MTTAQFQKGFTCCKTAIMHRSGNLVWNYKLNSTHSIQTISGKAVSEQEMMKAMSPQAANKMRLWDEHLPLSQRE